MENKNPENSPEGQGAEFANIFGEMVDLLQFALDNASKEGKPLSKELEAQLSKLEADVEDFCRLNKALSAKAKENSAKNATSDPLDILTHRERNIYERSQKLLDEAEERIKFLEKQLADAAAKGAARSEEHGFVKKLKRISQRKKWNKM